MRHMTQAATNACWKVVGDRIERKLSYRPNNKERKFESKIIVIEDTTDYKSKSKFIFNNTTVNNTFIDNINVKIQKQK